MLRRSLRILSVVALVILVAMPLITRFCMFELMTSHGALSANPPGIYFQAFSYNKWWLTFYRVGPRPLSDLVKPPGWEVTLGARRLLLPWWFLLAAWAMLTPLAWRLTRPRNLRQAFPIEPSPAISK